MIPVCWCPHPCPFPPCPCGEDHGSCPGGLCRDCFHESIWKEDREREWPYGPPHMHEDCCVLRRGETYCDCKASDASDTEWGRGS